MRGVKEGSVIIIKIERNHQTKKRKVIMMKRAGISQMKNIKCWRRLLMFVENQNNKGDKRGVIDDHCSIVGEDWYG